MITTDDILDGLAIASPQSMPERPWHPWSGCSPISPSCANCFTVAADGRETLDERSLLDLTKVTARGREWNGRLVFNENQLTLPERTPGSTVFHVCPHGDVFHEHAPDAWLDRVFDVMDRTPQHFYSILTKRGPRLAVYTSARYAGRRAAAHLVFCISVEMQREADIRIPALMQVPAPTKRLIVFSLEGPIDLTTIPGIAIEDLRRLMLVTIGGGALSRPEHAGWARQIGDDFRRLGVPVEVASYEESVAWRGF